jgi:UDP-sugar transporter A1/2/3
VSFAQYVPGAEAATVLPGAASKMLGLLAVGIACVTSGFSGVYFEKVLKSSATSLWVRNIQMSLTSVPLALLSVWWTDGDKVAANGFFYGYDWVVWQIVFNQAGMAMLPFVSLFFLALFKSADCWLRW